MPSENEAAVTRRTALALVGGAVVSAACDRAAFLAANVPATFGDYTRHHDVAYGPEPEQRLDVYLPTQPRTPAGERAALETRRGRAIVVFWHGGRWTFGDKAQYRFVGAALTELDCIAVLPNYRHYPHVLMPGFMADAARAVRWSAAHATELGADPDRLYLMGHSAGAHLAALVALDHRWLEAQGGVPRLAGLIGLSGPYDFLPLQEDDVKAMFGPPERYPESQPINFVRRDAPPALLIHGIRDDKVWPKNSRNLATALEARNVPVRLELLPHLGHADTVAALSRPARRRAPTLARIAEFTARSG